jgi:uroporphyrinogen decarboxylase
MGSHSCAKREPVFENLLKVLAREVPDRPTLFELFLNPRLYRKAVGPAAAAEIDAGADPDVVLRVRGFHALGYDYASVGIPGFAFPRGEREQLNTISLNAGHLISDRASLDQYPWPDPDAADYAVLDRLAEWMPPGMKLLVMSPCGVLENANFLVGFETLCFLLHDEPALVDDIFEGIGSRLLRYYQHVIRHPAVGGIIVNDDWGFKTQPMLTPSAMRRYVIPWHKPIVAAAHAAGKPAVLHSCGNLACVMDDIIDGIGFDGRHSYEDTIQPVEDFYDEYGGRIAVLGGMDVDFMIRSTPEAIRERARRMLEKTASRGGYALGTGNSVPEFLPDDHYFAMAQVASEF